MCVDPTDIQIGFYIETVVSRNGGNPQLSEGQHCGTSTVFEGAALSTTGYRVATLVTSLAIYENHGFLSPNG